MSPWQFLPSQEPPPSLTGNRWHAPREPSERSQRIPLPQVTRSGAQTASVALNRRFGAGLQTPPSLLDRRSPAGLGVGDLRSAKWQGQETLPQLGLTSAFLSSKSARNFRPRR